MKPLAALVFALYCGASVAQGLPEVADSGIEYKSPQAALEALEAKPGVTRREEHNWVVLSDQADHSIWSIAQPGNPAYPAAVKRHFFEHNGAVSVRMQVMCGASKAVCDQMVQLFQQGDERIRKQFGQ